MADDPRLTIRQRVTDRRLARDIASILPRDRTVTRPLPPATGSPALPGAGRITAAELAGQAATGIASPLTEQSRVTSTQTLPIDGTDGEVDVERIDQITFLDANGAAVLFILDHPDP